MTAADRIAIWKSMANHFLDNDTDDEIPETARLCVACGLTVEEARDIWCYEVSPAVWLNLYSVAGEWAGWDEAWLIDRIEKLRARPSGPIRRLFQRRAQRYQAWRAIEARMQDLLERRAQP